MEGKHTIYNFHENDFHENFCKNKKRKFSFQPNEENHTESGVADPEYLSGIPDPDFYPSRIQKPKRRRKKLVGYLFLSPQISQNRKLF